MADVAIGPSSPNGANMGQLWFNTATHQLNCWDGANWYPIGTPAGSLDPTLHLGGAGVGFDYVPLVNGSISGTPALTGSANGRGAMVYDHKNNRLWVYNGSAWKSAVFA